MSTKFCSGKCRRSGVCDLTCLDGNKETPACKGRGFCDCKKPSSIESQQDSSPGIAKDMDEYRGQFEGLGSGDGYAAILVELARLHQAKSGGYGTGADPYANFTAVASLTGQPRYLYATLRAIEKLTRVLSLHEQGRTEELGEEFVDVASLMVCAEALRRYDDGANL